MPLDDVHIQLKDLQVTISWSDCSHVDEMGNRNWQTTFICVGQRADIGEHATNLALSDISLMTIIEYLDSTLKSRTYQVSLPALSCSAILIATQMYGECRTYCCTLR